MKTLIVEDNDEERGLFERIVRLSGHEATACADGETAWEIYQREPHPLVILDWLLPGMDGLQLCRKIRSLPNGSQSVILIITGHDASENLQKILEAGADDYLAKPFGATALQVRLSIAARQVRILAERRKAEEALRRTQAELESRVAERTAELLRANESLKREIEERERLAERLNTLRKLNRRIASTLDPEQVLVSIAQAAAKLLNAERSSIFLLSPDGKTLELRSHFGIVPNPSGGPLILPVEGTVNGRVVRERKPIVVADVQRESGWVNPEWAKRHRVHAFIGVPLILRGEVA
ncbi:MAG: response regulator, partial [Nitrospinota bacterium]